MKGLDTLAAFLLGVYLLTVAVRGNSKRMIEAAQHDKGFLQWAVAVAVLNYVYGLPEVPTLAKTLMTITIIAFLIKAGPNFSEKIASVWNSLKMNG